MRVKEEMRAVVKPMDAGRGDCGRCGANQMDVELSRCAFWRGGTLALVLYSWMWVREGGGWMGLELAFRVLQLGWSIA